MNSDDMNHKRMADPVEVQRFRNQLLTESREALANLHSTETQLAQISKRLVEGETLSHEELKLVVKSIGFTINYLILRTLGGERMI